MFSGKEQLLSRIDNAKDQIRKLFLRQCENGQQTTSLPSTLAACGQFLNVLDRPQRGMHGTAAAIHVLGSSAEQSAVTLVQRMIEFIKQYYINNTTVGSTEAQQRERDSKNVIKLSETIIALRQVDGASAIIPEITSRLRQGFCQGEGWSWFIDNNEAPEPFPTAFACYAMSLVGSHNEVNRARKYLMDYLNKNSFKNNSNKKRIETDTMTDVFCLYVITLLPTDKANNEERKFLKEKFDKLWNRLEPLLDDDLEQNIEYWDKNSTCYVRIPWQLYLLALDSQYRLQWRFSSWVAQTKLTHILDMVEKGNYSYPYSGKFLSSRTYSILYETLSIIRQNIEHRLFFPQWDNLFKQINSRTGRFFVFIFKTCVLAYITYRWYLIRDVKDISGIFISVLGAWLFYFIFQSKRSH